MERLREITKEMLSICAEEREIRDKKLRLRDKARESGLKIDFINKKVNKL